MAPAQEALLIDPTLLQFMERLIDKGLFPVAAVIGVFALVWKFGWPKFGAVNPPPPPNAVADALRELAAEVRANHREAQAHREEMKDTISDLGQRVARIEGRLEK